MFIGLKNQNQLDFFQADSGKEGTYFFKLPLTIPYLFLTSIKTLLAISSNKAFLNSESSSFTSLRCIIKFSKCLSLKVNNNFLI